MVDIILHSKMVQGRDVTLVIEISYHWVYINILRKVI